MLYNTETIHSTIHESFYRSGLSTPAYILDEQALTKNLQIIESVKQATGCSVIMALKAFSSTCAFPTLKKVLDGCTCSSLYELQLSHDQFQKKSSIYSPAYLASDIPEINRMADSITFNSIAEMQRHLKYIDRSTSDIALRLNPEVSQDGNPLYNPCAPCSRFGVINSELDRDVVSSLDGVLLHTLCGGSAADLDAMMRGAEDKFGDVFEQVKWVNFGGGHMMTRSDYELELLIDLIKSFQEKYNVQVILEPGEAVVRETGWLVARVMDIVHNDQDIAILDTSATAHMPDVLEMPYRPNIEGAQTPNKTPYNYLLGGNTCLSGDIIGEYSFDAPLEIGQLLYFTDMAQYTIVKNTWFNGIALPSIVWRDKSEQCHLVQDYDYQDFLKRVG